MSKHAIILAGGKGTRLRPYTIVLPKPLMPIGEFPILEVIVRQLVRHGFTHITMAVNHQAEIIKAFFNDGSKWGVRIDYSLEDKPLGTMGPLRLIKKLPENFLIMLNCYQSINIEQHQEGYAMFTSNCESIYLFDERGLEPFNYVMSEMNVPGCPNLFLNFQQTGRLAAFVKRMMNRIT